MASEKKMAEIVSEYLVYLCVDDDNVPEDVIGFMKTKEVPTKARPEHFDIIRDKLDEIGDRHKWSNDAMYEEAVNYFREKNLSHLLDE